MAEKAALPMNRDVHIFAIDLAVDDDLFHQVPDDFLAIPVGRARGVPDRGKVGRESRDSRPLILGELRRLFAEKPIVIVADLTFGPQRGHPVADGHKTSLSREGTCRPRTRGYWQTPGL